MSATQIYTAMAEKVNGKLLESDYWVQFLEAISTEKALKVTNISSKVDYNNIDDADKDRLNQIGLKYGYPLNLILDNSDDFALKDVRSISYKIQNKTTVNGFIFPIELQNRVGLVYNFLWANTTKLVRAIDTTEIDTNLSGHDYETPFYGITPTVFVENTITAPLYLDSGTPLDETSTWYLDSDVVTSLASTMTMHYGIELICDTIITEDGVDYLCNSDWFDYIRVGSDYNRKATNIPHPACQITGIMDQTGEYDAYNTSDTGYTIVDIELQIAVTPTYIGKVAISTPNDFYRIVAGTGKKGINSQYGTNPFSSAILHWGFDEDNTTAVIDETANGYDGAITGTTTRVTGIVGKTVDFDGSTSVTEAGVVITNVDSTVNLWFNFADENVDMYLFDLGYLEMLWNDATSKLDIIITGASTTASINYAFTDFSTDILCQVEIDIGSSNMNLYLDATLVDTISIAGIGTIAGTETVEIGWDGSTDYFTGLIDDFSINNKIMSSAEKTAILTNKLASLTSLGNKVYTDVIDVDEITDENSRYIVQSYIKGNTINDVILGTGDGTDYTFSGTVDVLGIKPTTFRIKYEDTLANTYYVWDDSEGNITGDRITGTIDYTTGAYDLYFYKDYKTESYLLGTGDGSTTVFADTLNTNLQAGHVDLQYFIGATLYEVTDDGAGNITGTGISSGTVNYTTGAISITFSSPPVADSPIKVTFIYRLFSIPENLNEITAEYRTITNMDITEFGIEDDSGKLVVYGTFPKVSFGVGDYYLSANFIIEQTP